VNLLALKVSLAPALILGATLAGRRWGPAVGGWLAGLPLTSGPVSVVLVMEQGPDFAAAAAVGTLLGLVSHTAFCVTYAFAARHAGWTPSVAAALAAFAATTLLLRPLPLSPGTAAVLVGAVLVPAALVIPVSVHPTRAVSPPRGDLALRMLAASVLVLALTGFARLLGPRLAGLLSPVPVFVTVLTVFAHRTEGAHAATRLLRGAVLGSTGFAAFFVVVAAGLRHGHPVATYAAAALVSLAIHAATLVVVRRLP
jgi:hypothetical protein